MLALQELSASPAISVCMSVGKVDVTLLVSYKVLLLMWFISQGRECAQAMAVLMLTILFTMLKVGNMASTKLRNFSHE